MSAVKRPWRKNKTKMLNRSPEAMESFKQNSLSAYSNNKKFKKKTVRLNKKMTYNS